MAEAALLDPGDTAWADALSRIHHDVYHLPEYVRLDATLSGHQPVAFRYAEAGRVLLLPLLLRPIPDSDLRDATSPYGYPGPVSNAALDDFGFWSRAFQAMTDLLAGWRVVTAFVRLHPLFTFPAKALAEVGTVVHHGETV